jgi:hypothetical protein
VTSERSEQQTEERAACSARFTGTLAELGTADLIQLLQLAGKDALITVQQPGLESRLWCSAGAVVDAESGRLRGELAAYRILGFDEGFLSAELRPIERAREINVGTPRLLLEAARRKDECAQLLQRLGDPRQCYRCADDVRAAPEPSAKEQALLQSFGAGRSLAEMLSQSELGDWETLQAIARLRDAGALVDAGSSRAPAELEPSISAPESARLDPREHSSTAPLEVEQHEPPVGTRRPLPRWSYAALTALVLISTGYAFGMRSAQNRAAAQAPSPLTAAAPVEQARPTSFALELHVEPPGAEIVLDGAHIATGSFTTRLPRDGRSHELRVSAPGFIGARIWFIDTAPLKELRLEPLPAAASGDTTAVPAPAQSAARVSPRATRVRKALRGEPSEPAEPAAKTTAAPSPAVDPATPVVRLIE